MDDIRKSSPVKASLIFLMVLAGTLAAEAPGDGAALEMGGAVYLGAFKEKPGSVSDEMRAAFSIDSPAFGLIADFSFLNDGKYPSHNVYELGHYFQPNDCRIRLGAGGLSFSGGRGIHSDAVESPYSLFISSKGIPAFHMDLSWETQSFLYESRWVSLNWNSIVQYEGSPYYLMDRGLNYKVYEVKLGAFRFGFQDASVYVGEAFDPESFISPLPAYIQQMVLASSGRPYSQVANPNSLMGFFGDWSGRDFSAYGQFLIDDINASFLAPVLGWAIPALNEIDNVQKIAWSLGGAWDSPIGKLSFHHGGATKYTFESTYTDVTSPSGFGFDAPGYNNLPYPYAYWPVTTYPFYARTCEVPPSDNWIGYRHGENNLAFMASWEGSPGKERPWGFDAKAELEYSITGSQSPANPWHELDTWQGIGKAFVMFDESVLEHSLALAVDARKPLGNWTFNAGFELGWIWNPLSPVEVPGHPEEAKIWKPSPGTDKPVCGLRLGVSYRVDWEPR